jgi:RND family efflux transporter MFP subunit
MSIRLAPLGEPVKRPAVPILVLSLSGALVILALWLFATSPGAKMERDRAETQAQGVDEMPRAEPAVTVDALELRTSEASMGVDFAGILEPVRSVVIGAEVEGRVIEVPAVEHDAVEAGELLVRLDPALPSAAVARARASVQRASAANDLASAELGRRKNLSRQGVASDAEFDRALRDERTSAGEVAEAQAALREAATRLDKTRIAAPFAGVVSKLDLEPGAYLRAGDAVAEMIDLSEIEVEVGVGDRQVLFLQAGQPATLLVDVYPGESFAGQILRVGRAPDAETRKYPVPVRFPNAAGRLLPGMIGTVRFELEASGPTLHVPRRAVRREFELDYLYVLEPENGDSDVAVAKRRRVSTRPVAFRPDMFSIEEGVQDGERVAVTGIRELRDGQRVRVREGGAGATP